MESYDRNPPKSWRKPGVLRKFEYEFGCDKKRAKVVEALPAVSFTLALSMWAQLGTIQRPSDYESDAANQLSYGP